MKPFCLVLRAGYSWLKNREELWIKSLKESLTIERKFSKIKFDTLEHKDNDIAKVVKIHESTLKFIETCYSDFDFQPFMDILVAVKKLETVVIKSSSFQSIDEVKVLPLRKLKHVKVSGCNLKVLKLFSASQITSLEIDTFGKEDFLKDFLSEQLKLEELKVESNGSEFTKFFQNDFPLNQKSYRLKRLSIRCSNDRKVSRPIEANFINFLTIHACSLQELEIMGTMSEEIYKFIFTQLRSLKKLSVDVRQLPSSGEFYEFLRPAESIKELTLTEKCTEENTVGNVLGCFSAVEKLDLQFVNDKILKVLGSKFKKLQNLSINRFSFSYVPMKLIFPCLKEIHVGEVRSISNWNLFIKNNPKIERLTIKELYLQDINKAAVKLITHAENIKHIKIQGGLKAMKEFFDIVKIIGWNKLESMELIVKNMNERFTRPFFFNMPSNKTLWNPECPYLDDFVWDRGL